MVMIKVFVCFLFSLQVLHSIKYVDYDIYPSIPENNRRSVKQPKFNLGFNKDNENPNRKINNRVNGINMNNFAVVGGSAYVAYYFVKQAVNFIQSNPQYFKPLLRSQPPNVFTATEEVNKEPIYDAKKENEELWNAILKIHNEQSRLSDSIQRIKSELQTDLISASRTIQEATEDSIYKLVSQLETITRNIDENDSTSNKKIATLTSKLLTLTTTTNEQFTTLQKSQNTLIIQHDEAITSKLSQFKSDLQEVLLKRGSSATSNEAKKSTNVVNSLSGGRSKSKS
jgi:hypothetical protein